MNSPKYKPLTYTPLFSSSVDHYLSGPPEGYLDRKRSTRPMTRTLTIPVYGSQSVLGLLRTVLIDRRHPMASLSLEELAKVVDPQAVTLIANQTQKAVVHVIDMAASTARNTGRGVVTGDDLRRAADTWIQVVVS